MTEYALAGLVVIPFLLAPRWVIGLACACALAFYLVMPLLPLSIPWPTPEQLRQHIAEATAVYGAGSYPAILRFSVREIANLIPLHILVFPRTLGLFLLGMFTWRLGILQHPREHKRALTVAAATGIAIGAILTARDSELAPVVLSIGYGATIVWLVEFSPARWFLSLFGSLGRMAFTNYIGQSVIFGFIFFGYGLGLFARLDAAATLLLGSVLYFLQMLVSGWWLLRYRFGPLEWLWRTLMYGRKQPMLR